MSNRIRNTFLLLSILALFMSPNFARAASFGIVPAYPRSDNTRSDSIFVHTITPGSKKEDGVKVVNGTSSTRSLILYARDSARSSGGGFACEQLSKTSVGVGNWIKFTLDDLDESVTGITYGINEPGSIELSIPPQSEIIIPFSISVPPGVSVGEHNGCVLVQEIKEDSNQAGLSLALRRGIRVAITVPGEIVRSLENKEFNIERQKGSIILLPSVTNTGTVSLDVDVSVSVKNVLGGTHKVLGGQFPVLRGDTYDFKFSLKNPFWGGLYKVNTAFAYDNSANAGIGINTGSEPEVLATKSIWFFSFPRPLGLLAEILLLFTFLFCVRYWMAIRKRKRWLKSWVYYTVRDGDTIPVLSKKYSVHWRTLVQVNKIEAPYQIQPGQKIRVPRRQKHS